MTRAEKLIANIGKDSHLFEVLNLDCPSDHGMDDMPGCWLKTDGNPNDVQCFKCWMSELGSDVETRIKQLVDAAEELLLIERESKAIRKEICEEIDALEKYIDRIKAGKVDDK